MTDNNTFGLTNREMEVSEYMKYGYSNSEIAKKMNVSSHTVKIHISNIIGKTYSNNRTHAAYKLAVCGFFKQMQQEIEQYLKLH